MLTMLCVLHVCLRAPPVSFVVGNRHNYVCPVYMNPSFVQSTMNDHYVQTDTESFFLSVTMPSDIVKLTAQFVARNGAAFLDKLMMREQVSAV